VSPSDQPVEIRLTLTREEAVTFLERLAREPDFRAEFEGNPRGVFAQYGIEVTPEEAIPASADAPEPDAIERALSELSPPTVESPYNRMFRSAALIALLAKPETIGGPEAS
jgi:hypothetical protein